LHIPLPRQDEQLLPVTVLLLKAKAIIAISKNSKYLIIFQKKSVLVIFFIYNYLIFYQLFLRTQSPKVNQEFCPFHFLPRLSGVWLRRAPLRYGSAAPQLFTFVFMSSY
jgi:hypothetical protein